MYGFLARLCADTLRTKTGKLNVRHSTCTLKATTLTAPLLPLPTGDIHLWFCRHGDASGADLAAACQALLTPEDRSRYERFHFARDRHRFLLTRALVRCVLSRYAPVPPQAWRFDNGPWGRPRIQSPFIESAQGLDFNLSHTNGLIVMALARDMALGVDAENVGRKAAFEVADQFFSAAESAALKALAPSLQAERFFALWTLKESYIKARAMGLQIPLDSFGFALDDHHGIDFTLDEPHDDGAQRWHFWQLQPTPDHLVAVCAASTESHRARIVCRETMPTQGETMVDLRTVRASTRIPEAGAFGAPDSPRPAPE